MVKYQIMQIEDIEHCDYVFRGYSKDKFNIEDYEVAYEGELQRTDEQDIDICEILFYMFNVVRPKDFKGRSLSVSDVVVIIDGQYKTTYYCDTVGWVQIK
jgi:hypothetical protein